MRQSILKHGTDAWLLFHSGVPPKSEKVDNNPGRAEDSHGFRLISGAAPFSGRIRRNGTGANPGHGIAAGTPQPLGEERIRGLSPTDPEKPVQEACEDGKAQQC